MHKVMDSGHSGLVHVRGLGLMNAVEFADPARCKAVLARLLDEHHVIAMAAGVSGAVLRWMPPLVVTADEVDLVVEAFAESVAATA
jgi:4-aminobutyrate aminotransferase-like enzyme